MSLRDRLLEHDNLSGLELARYERFADSRVLARGGRRLGAIYLLGYFVEITLKVAFFRSLGFSTEEPITIRDLKTVAALARNDLSVSEGPEGFHSFVFWAQALVELCRHCDRPLPRELSLELAWRCQRMSTFWSPSLRYSRDVTQQDDWQTFLADADWIDGISDEITVQDHDGQGGR